MPSNSDGEFARNGPLEAKPASSLLFGVSSAYGVIAVRVVGLIVLTPLLVSRLGGETYGLWVILVAIAGYGTLLDLGVTQAVWRFVARAIGQGDVRALKQATGTAAGLLVGTGVLGGLLLYVAAHPLARWLEASDVGGPDFEVALQIMAVRIAVGTPARLLPVALAARESFVPGNIVAILGSILEVGLSIVVLLAGLGLPGLAGVQLGVTVLSASVTYVICRRLFPEMPFDIRWMSRACASSMLAYGGYALILSLADQLKFRAAAVVVGRTLGPAEIQYLSIPMTLVNQGALLLGIASSLAVPRLSRMDAEGAEDSMESFLLRGSRLCTLLSIVLFTALVILGPSLMRIWVGPEFDRSVPILLVLGPAYALYRSHSVATAMVMARAKHRLLAFLMLGEGVLSLALSVILAPVWGIYGVAAAIALPMSLSALAVLPWYVSRVSRVSAGRYLREVLLRNWLVMAGAMLLGLAPSWIFGASHAAALLGAGLAAGLVVVVLRDEVREAVAFVRAGLARRAPD